MSEFELDHGSKAGADLFKSFDSFTQGYVEAMFFTEIPTGEDWNVNMLAPSAIERIRADCASFQEKAGNTIWMSLQFPSYCESQEHAGRDFWYTSQGHGCGFWDGDWPEPEATQMTRWAHLFAERHVYKGDDNLIYVE